jgi:hypothetical protein
MISKVIPFSVNRRRFLTTSAALAGGLLLDYPFDGLAHVAPLVGKNDPLPPKAWRQLGLQLKGSLIRPGETGFTNLALPNNLRYRSIKPGGIALCADVADIATSLKWAKRHGIPIVARGGGHSYAGFSCTEGLMINLRQFNATTYDAARQTIRIGGGIRNGAVYSALQSIGRSITHGRCPTVGAGGFLLGGGLGFDMRRHGIASDKLVSTEMVLADGEIVTANANVNADLFWACRGGAGGNFGINTDFTMETFPVDRSIELQLTWDAVSDEFLAALFLNLENAPAEFGCKITLAPGLPLPGRPTPINVFIIGQFIGTIARLDGILAPINAMQAPSSHVIEQVAYWSASAFLASEDGPGYSQERSRFINGPMTPELIATIRDWLPRWPNAQGAGTIKFHLTGGATQSLAPTDTAFVHRDSQWLSTIAISWTPGQSMTSRYRAHRWQNGFYAMVTPLCGGGAYQNFSDPSLQDWAEAYYGENLPRLRAIKSAVDPDNQFRYPQSIRPFAPGRA